MMDYYENYMTVVIPQVTILNTPFLSYRNKLSELNLHLLIRI